MSEPLQFRLHDSVFKYREGGAPVTVMAAEMVKVDYDPVDGFLTYYKDCRYPINGFCGEREMFALTASDVVKKYIKGWLSFFSTPPLLYLAPLFVFLPPRVFQKLVYNWFFNFSDCGFHVIKEFVFEPQHWCRAVKEFRKGILALGITDMYQRLADIFSVILENDRRYRYVLQEAFSLLNLDNLKKNTAKEVKRVFYIIAERDKARNWKRMGQLIYLLILIRPEIKRAVQTIADNLNLEALALNRNDKYCCLMVDGYNYFGKNSEERAEMWADIHFAEGEETK